MKLFNPVISSYNQHSNLIILFFASVIVEFMLLLRYRSDIEKYFAKYFIQNRLYLTIIFVSIFISSLWILKIDNLMILKFGDSSSHLLILNSISQVQQPFLKLGTIDSFSGVINLNGYYYPDLLHYLGALLIQINILDPIQAYKSLNVFIHGIIFPMSIGIILNRKFKNVNSLIYFFLLMSVPFFPLTLMSTGNFNSVAGFIISILCAALISETKTNVTVCFLLSCLIIFLIHPSYIISFCLFTLIFKISDIKSNEHRLSVNKRYVTGVLLLTIAAFIIVVLSTDIFGLLKSFIESLPFGQTSLDIRSYDVVYLGLFMYKNFFLFSNYFYFIPFGLFFLVYNLIYLKNTYQKYILFLIYFVYTSSFFSGFEYPLYLISFLSTPFYSSPIRIFPLFVYSLYLISFFLIDSRMRQTKLKFGRVLHVFFIFNFVFTNLWSFTTI
jgi:hypothetical protein